MRLTDTPIIRVSSLCIMCLSFLSPVVLYAIIVKKTPSWDDIFRVHEEAKTQSKVLLIGTIFLFILAAILMYMYDTYGIHSIPHRIAADILWTCMFFMWFILSCVSTRHRISKHEEIKLADLVDSETLSTPVAPTKSEAAPCDFKEIPIDVFRLLSHAKYINIFMQHLSKEYVHCYFIFL